MLLAFLRLHQATDNRKCSRPAQCRWQLIRIDPQTGLSACAKARAEQRCRSVGKPAERYESSVRRTWQPVRRWAKSASYGIRHSTLSSSSARIGAIGTPPAAGKCAIEAVPGWTAEPESIGKQDVQTAAGAVQAATSSGLAHVGRFVRALSPPHCVCTVVPHH